MKKAVGGRDRDEWWQLFLAYLDAGFDVEFKADFGNPIGRQSCLTPTAPWTQSRLGR